MREFGIKLRYLHRNPRGPQAALLLRWLGWKPVKRGLVRDPGDWKWSGFRHYAFREMGVVEIESEWTGRDRELKVTGGKPACSSARVRPTLRACPEPVEGLASKRWT